MQHALSQKYFSASKSIMQQVLLTYCVGLTCTAHEPVVGAFC